MIRMIHLCLLATLLVPLPAGFAANGTDSKSEATIKEAVLATNAAMIAAADRLDVDGFFTHIVDSNTTPVVQNGVVFKTRQTAKDAVNRGMRGLVKIERHIDNPEVTVLSPDAALLVGEGTMTATTDDGRVMTSNFSVSLVFVRRDAGWKLLHGHYSVPRQT